MSTSPVFRRATADDAVALARTTFLDGERVDLNTLAGGLDVSRATLHRWVQTREQLLDRVLGEVTKDFVSAALVSARAAPDDGIAHAARQIVAAISGSPPLRGFAAREPELALRLVLGQTSSVRRVVVTGLGQLLHEIYADVADPDIGLAATLCDVGLALEWATIVVGEEPSPERLANVTRALIAGARAGALGPPARP